MRSEGKSWKRWLGDNAPALFLRFGALCILLLTVAKYGKLLWDLPRLSGDVDFKIYYQWAYYLREGKNPFEWIVWDPYVPPLIYPGQFFFLLPFTWLPFLLSFRVWLIVDFVSVVLLFFIAQALARKRVFGEWQGTSIWWPWLCLLLMSQPVQMGLYNVQLAIPAAIALFGAIVIRNWLPAGVLLSISAAMKYSLTPLFGIGLLVKRRYAVCCLGFLLFILWSLFPVAYTIDLDIPKQTEKGAVGQRESSRALALPNCPLFRLFGYKLYSDYFRILATDWQGQGYNSFAGGGGYDLVNFDFLKLPTLNALVKISFLFIFIYIAYLERNGMQWNLPFLFVTSSITCLLVYHRVHDALLAVICLVLIAQDLYARRRWRALSIPLFLLALFDMPQGPWMRLSAHISSWVGEQRLIYLVDYGEYAGALPLPAIVMFLISLYSVAFYFQYRRNGYTQTT